jgi:DNA-binding NarL/FixJ family response regulator
METNGGDDDQGTPAEDVLRSGIAVDVHGHDGLGPCPPDTGDRPAKIHRSAPALRVSLVEDELLLRRMLEQLLMSRDGLRLVHSLGTAQEARVAITPGSTDVLMVDVGLTDGNGITLAADLQRVHPALGVLVLSAEDVLGLFTAAQRHATKAWSYLSKRSSFATTVLLRAVVAASRGEQVIDPYLVHDSVPRAGSDLARLSPAQLRVLALVAEGFSNDAVAQHLGITTRSVENHLLAVYKMLGAHAEGRNQRVTATLAFLTQTSRSPRA